MKYYQKLNCLFNLKAFYQWSLAWTTSFFTSHHHKGINYSHMLFAPLIKLSGCICSRTFICLNSTKWVLLWMFEVVALILKVTKYNNDIGKRCFSTAPSWSKLEEYASSINIDWSLRSHLVQHATKHHFSKMTY